MKFYFTFCLSVLLFINPFTLRAEKYTFDFRNDTLYVTGDSVKMPNNIVVVTNNEHSSYKKEQIPQFDVRCGDDVSNDLYNNVWTAEKLNPYNVPIDSLPDSLYVDLVDYCVPAKGYVTSTFGRRGGRFHYGTDIKVQTGDPIYSAFDGVIRIVDYERNGYGNYIVIRHENGLETVYAHLSRVWVKETQKVKCGEIIGVGGNTGRSTGSHLHFEMRYIGNAFNTELIFDYANRKAKFPNYIVTKKESFSHNAVLKELAAIRYHTIKSGENLGRIASRYGTTVTKLCRMNNMTPKTTIYAGKRIRVR